MNKYRLLLLLFLLPACYPLSSQAQSAADSASFPVRGFHLDLRIQVMQLPALKAFADRLAGQGINTLVMEWEGTYPSEKEPLIANRYAYTREQVADFIRYCASRKIRVIPLQQSFGHVEYILRNNKYAALREDQKDFSQVCPSEPELNKKLFTELYADLISTHNSPYLHIGGDETYLLGHCEKCRKKAAEIGLSRLYFDHIKMLCDIVVGMGKRPVVWADIALKYPEYIRLLPKETIFIDWNYGWDVNRFGDHSKLLNSGYEIWGAPSIRSHPDNYYITDWQKHFRNIRDFIPLSRKMKYKGMVMTSWSTSGVYSSLFGSEDDLIDLYAIRHVYPLSGFPILVEYYLRTLNTADSIPVEAFITGYTRTHYGFSGSQSAAFRKALFATPYVLQQGKPFSPAKIALTGALDSATTAWRTLQALRPAKGQEEFRHYVLMAAIRVQYLTFMQIEAEVNDPSFTAAKAPAFVARLEKLMAGGKQLDDEFTALNAAFLYPAAIAEENTLRNQKIRVLYDRLAKIK
ncbi:MAG: beta-N-acetylhexosaminidase [Mucilaginibacter polytrichastri]|nr:beta-N-acetylhexosaminidase [Mucilaginibacter polytrichastri]